MDLALQRNFFVDNHFVIQHYLTKERSHFMYDEEVVYYMLLKKIVCLINGCYTYVSVNDIMFTFCIYMWLNIELNDQNKAFDVDIFSKNNKE